MPTVGGLAAVVTAQTRGPGRPVTYTPLNILSRQVAFELCRTRIKAAKTVTDVVVAIDPENCSFDEDEGRWNIPRMWHFLAQGKYDFRSEYLSKMEDAAPGVTALLRHDFWLLIDDAPLSRAVLIEIVRKLPPAFAQLLLSGPDRHTGRIGIQPIGDYELFGVQSLGSLDAVAALLAASRLCEEEHFDEGTRDCAGAAIRLFLRIALSPPFSTYLPEIWPFIERQYARRLELLNLCTYGRLQRDYRVVLDIGGQLTVFGLSEDQHLDFLLIADRWYFGNVVSSLKEITPKLRASHKFGKYPGLIQALVVRHEELSLHQDDPLMNDVPISVDDFEQLDKSMRREVPGFYPLSEYPLHPSEYFQES